METPFPGESTSEYCSHTFTNEYGNTITARYAVYDDGRREPIRLDLVGPTSLSENNITRLEAEALHKLLTVILSK